MWIFKKIKIGNFLQFLFIAKGETNDLKKIHNHLEKAENIFFLHMVVDFL